MPNAIIKPSLVQNNDIFLDDEKEFVKIIVGNATLTLHYEECLKLSQALRMRAKSVKRRCGDMARHWSVIAEMDGIKG